MAENVNRRCGESVGNGNSGDGCQYGTVLRCRVGMRDAGGGGGWMRMAVEARCALVCTVFILKTSSIFLKTALSLFSHITHTMVVTGRSILSIQKSKFVGWLTTLPCGTAIRF